MFGKCPFILRLAVTCDRRLCPRGTFNAELSGTEEQRPLIIRGSKVVI